jgi:hypothetical protein
MSAELTPYMNEFEVDQIVEFLEKISDSEFDINPSVEDSAAQLRIILGAQRYEMIKAQWSIHNQRLIPDGKTKYIHLATGIAYDGLDPEDNPQDYNMIVM